MGFDDVTLFFIASKLITNFNSFAEVNGWLGPRKKKRKN